MGVNIEKVFGENVFDDSVMKVRLPKSDFERVKTLMHEGGEITEDLADVVAQAYVNVAKECNNGDMQRLTKIDERFEFDHPAFERAFDSIRSRDVEADRVLDFVEMQMGRERE